MLMKRTLFWIAGGLLLGALIHLVVILTLPGAATRDVWHRLEDVAPIETMTVLDPITQ